MSTEINGRVVGRGGGMRDSAKSLSTMNLITLSWLLEAGRTSALPDIGGGRSLDAAVSRRAHSSGRVS